MRSARRRREQLAKISELEGVVLGIVRTERDCTAYRVRATLRASPSSYWSASAGAIYPLLRRLEEAGLLASEADPTDGRGRRLLRLTSAGRQAHRTWMLMASSPDIASEVTDAIRSRAFFLESLSPAERRRFAADALNALETHLDAARADLASADAEDRLAYVAAKGGVLRAEARVAWMREVVTVVASVG